VALSIVNCFEVAPARDDNYLFRFTIAYLDGHQVRQIAGHQLR
jgi:hypothetical protein